MLGVLHSTKVALIGFAAIVGAEVALEVTALVEDLVAAVDQARELVVEVRRLLVQHLFNSVPTIRNPFNTIFVHVLFQVGTLVSLGLITVVLVRGWL